MEEALLLAGGWVWRRSGVGCWGWPLLVGREVGMRLWCWDDGGAWRRSCAWRQACLVLCLC